MTDIMSYNQDNGDQIAELLVGHRIVEAVVRRVPLPENGGWRKYAEGRLVLDDGTVLYLTGNDGGCSCEAGCYPLARVATVENIITSARVEAKPAGDHFDTYGKGVYRIYVVADATEINVAEFSGTDGNGYYGTGFSLTVLR